MTPGEVDDLLEERSPSSRASVRAFTGKSLVEPAIVHRAAPLRIETSTA
jgi:hypothetical protein